MKALSCDSSHNKVRSLALILEDHVHFKEVGYLFHFLKCKIMLLWMSSIKRNITLTLKENASDVTITVLIMIPDLYVPIHEKLSFFFPVK